MSDSFEKGRSLTIHDVEYVIQEPLGFGSYGAVFKCLNTVTKEQVVIKRCRLCRESGIQISEIREITQLKALKHPNIVKLLDVGIDVESKICMFTNMNRYTCIPYT
jgi:serine/threonine protein kinase